MKPEGKQYDRRALSISSHFENASGKKQHSAAQEKYPRQKFQIKCDTRGILEDFEILFEGPLSVTASNKAKKIKQGSTESLRNGCLSTSFLCCFSSAEHEYSPSFLILHVSFTKSRTWPQCFFKNQELNCY